VRQYLARHASPEVSLADAIAERYRSVLVVPAFREAPGLLAQYRAALDSANGRVLVIVVVNAAAPHAVSSWPVHEELLADLRGQSARQISSAPPAWLSCHDSWDALSIDRAHPDTCFPERQGVGLARRIGCDVALALHAAGRLEDPFFYCTDADAELPAGYFDGLPTEAPSGSSGITFSFWHVPGGDPAIDAATALYELGLRYYVSGLARAGSPYAFHAIGSALAVRASAYAAVRGFPKRLAGEDFYLLNKLVKVAPIWRDDRRVIRLRSRASLRTAHGTGVAAVKLAAQLEVGSALFYHPQIFMLLELWLVAMKRFAQSRELGPVRRELLAGAGPMAACLDPLLNELGAWQALEQAARQTRTERSLLTRLHTWFDGFRTLKLVHGLRGRGLASLPFRQALAGSWCCTPAQAERGTVDELRKRLLDQTAQPAGSQVLTLPSLGTLDPARQNETGHGGSAAG
jgi:hypothetical protein